MAIPVLPESAPFTPAQRAWLNGFFAGALSLEIQSASSLVPAAMPVVAAGDAPVSTAIEVEEVFPWHDPALTLDERLALAEGRPREQRLMAAMAQLDCGTCGYVCQTYAAAIARGDDRDLTKCTPGGKETTKKLKEIMAELSA